MASSTQERQETCAVCGTTQRFMFEYQKHWYYRCPKCALVSTYSLPDSATIEAHYARKFKSGNYQLFRDFSQEYMRVYDGFVQILDHRLAGYGLKWQGLKVLDVGCFTGEFLELLQAWGADVYGLELQSQAVEIANQKLPGRIFQADVFSNNFPQMRFDIVTLLGVIEHVVDPLRLLRRSTELLQGEGVVMVQTPNSASFLARMMRGLWPPYAPIEHIHLFSEQSLTLALDMLGFGDVIVKPHWKRLPIAYAYRMLQNFGPEWYRLFKPIYGLLPRRVTKASLPFYVGEMIVTARKQ